MRGRFTQTKRKPFLFCKTKQVFCFVFCMVSLVYVLFGHRVFFVFFVFFSR